MPSAFEQALAKLVKDIKDLKTEQSKLVTAEKSRENDYRNAVSMVYEAQKAITELKEEIKKGSKTAPEAMKKWHANYPKIFDRIKPTSEELGKVKASLQSLKAEVAKSQSAADKLNKEAGKAVMTDVKTAAATLKTALTDLKSINDGVTKAINLATEVPKAPSGLFT